MHYMLMIHTDETDMGTMTPEDAGRIVAEMDRFDAEISDRGQNLGSIRLQPSMTATTVRVRDGETFTSDGPFVETKEQLGGVYLINADDLDEALGIAARMPTATFCTIEVRPIMGIDLRQVVTA